MTPLVRGANASVPPERLDVVLEWAARSGAGIAVDASAYLLTAAGRVRGDQDMVFYNQVTAEGGAVAFRDATGGQARFEVDPARLSAAVERVVFCLTIEEAQARRQAFGMLDRAAVRLGPVAGAPELAFEAPVAGATEAALIVGELYRRNGAWKFRAVGQGFDGGLGPLARSFGMDVADTAPSPPRPAPSGAPAAPPAPAPAPPAPKPVSLSKISLEKPGQSISLEKPDKGFGEVRINLNWSRGRQGVFSKPIDLDLACLYELRDGSKGLVQALGETFGDFDDAPWIELSGDDRTGDGADGETLRLNGCQWSEIRRALVFAFIYGGAPNWKATDGVVLVETPGQPKVEVRMSEGRNDRPMCAIAALENVNGTIKVTRLVEYFRGHQDLDRKYGFGMRWVGASKD